MHRAALDGRHLIAFPQENDRLSRSIERPLHILQTQRAILVCTRHLRLREISWPCQLVALMPMVFISGKCLVAYEFTVVEPPTVYG